MTQGSKMELDITVSLQQDLKKLAAGVLQLYKNYVAYKANKFTQLPYDNEIAFIPILLTLEEWYISLNPQLTDLLYNEVLALFNSEGFDNSLLSEFPFHVLSITEFERQFQVMCKLGFIEYFKKRNANTLAEIAQNFQYTELFKPEFKAVFMDRLDQINRA